MQRGQIVFPGRDHEKEFVHVFKGIIDDLSRSEVYFEHMRVRRRLLAERDKLCWVCARQPKHQSDVRRHKLCSFRLMS